MYLKSIEIHGFKSFANRIKLEFHNGITGIVGPNGSGKSNVADAVRWVLGEQRIKQLRGSSMQDVIFAGTELRKPLSFAYVAITLDNSDHQLDIAYDEVTVARRLYRSGESEYLINGTPCRLKDISELFYDTGIGKEGYSIIGQGQIEKILSDKPEDRRELFDEAAGIVKFKRRKESAEKKLDSEQSNLVRVSDILSELERQVGPLEKQSEKAKVYLAKREALKGVDINVFLLENADLRGKLETASSQYEIVQKDIETAGEALASAKNRYEETEQRIEALGKAIDEARDTITRDSIVRGKLEGDIKVYQEQIRSARNNAEHFEVRLGSLNENVSRVSEERDVILARETAARARIDEAAAGRQQIQNELSAVQKEISDLTAFVDESKQKVLALLDERANIRSRQGAIAEREEQLRIRKAELTSRLVTARSEENRQNEQIEKASELFEKISAEVAQLQKGKKETEQEIGALKERMTASDEVFRAEQMAFHQAKSKMEMLQNLSERYEGFGGSVRRVMENRSRESGLIGVVADLLKTEARYETAIEVALGGSIQNIVTENEDTARRMIELLKREKAGRATFLPLTAVKDPGPFRNPEYLREPGILGTADTLVTRDPRYDELARNLLGRIIVADTFEHASKVQKKSRQSLRIVTLEGELFAAGGAISGGAFRSGGNLLARRRELSDAEKEMKLHQKAMDDAQAEINEAKNRRNVLRETLSGLDMQIQRKLIEQNTARMDVIREKEKQEEAVGSLSALRDENSSIEKMTEELSAEKTEIAGKLADSFTLEKELSERAAEESLKLEGLRSKESAKSAELAAGDLNLQKITQEHDFEAQNLERLNSEVERYSGELSEVEEGMAEGRKEIAEKEENIRKIELTITASREKQAEAEQQLKENSEEKDKLSQKQKEFFAEREQISDQLSGLDKENFRLRTSMERLQEAIDSQINYLWDEYQMTPSDAEEHHEETSAPLSEMKKQVRSLKQEINNLGPVNVNAIEEYRNVLERYNFLKNQHDDLVAAAENLKGIITELDENMRKQFKEQFARISGEFDTVFKALFGGGHGRLELVEDEDILEAGIRVIAQPPGKKLQNMMQMSGGEKSLTAISLLFAIQNLKPSPFCLLDEIEAALDESNVGRFSDYLHKLTRHTQFIVITHRRGTMERADRLYGITMQEKGVSALVSVSLIEKSLTDR